MMVKIKGCVILQKKNVLDLNDYIASMVDNLDEFLGKVVSFQLISAVYSDPANGMRGKLGSPAYLEEWTTTPDTKEAGECMFTVHFDWDGCLGIPGAFIIRNQHCNQFYLKTLTLDDVPGKGRVHFVCNSWIYPTKCYTSDRIFFMNHSYLPIDTPEPLRKYREEELVLLRGTGCGELQEWDRVYDYALYNDLGDPDECKELARPVLGGSQQYPYPRRGRTGRPLAATDPRSECRLPGINLDIYIPRDERFGHLRLADFLAYSIKAIIQFLVPELKALCSTTPDEFATFQDVLNLYEEGIKLPDLLELDKLKDLIPLELIKELVRTDGERLLKFPMPQIIQVDKCAWRSDEEFTREMLAGMNPVIIRCLVEFPPTSNLDPNSYGCQHSSITEEHIIKNLDGLSVEEALNCNKLFILDHHDSLMPYIDRINCTDRKTYASRTLLFLKKDGSLRPLAIELSLPNPEGEQKGAISQVFTPADHGVEWSIWQLAKAYVTVNDTGVHKLISHWLNTHCVIEPFVIATNRQLSVLHPIYKLLHPHFRDTMNMNAFSRQILVNASGLFEATTFPGKFAMEMSSMAYKNWVLADQGLPTDLLKRGMAVPDLNYPHKLRLLIDDYPYAVDGLDIWSAIETWVTEYCSIYYPCDGTLQTDIEIQAWWKEIREVGHGDKKDELCWPTMQTLTELTATLTTIIWIASALHAAVSFGQYTYGGFILSHPTVSRRFMPGWGSTEFAELECNPDRVFLRTINSRLQASLEMCLMEILSRHTSDEVYLGQAVVPEWTYDSPALDAYRRFGEKLVEIEKEIMERNKDGKLKNRVGPACVPYTMLYPNTSDVSMVGGLTGKGIPNSVSI